MVCPASTVMPSIALAYGQTRSLWKTGESYRRTSSTTALISLGLRSQFGKFCRVLEQCQRAIA